MTRAMKDLKKAIRRAVGKSVRPDVAGMGAPGPKVNYPWAPWKGAQLPRLMARRLVPVGDPEGYDGEDPVLFLIVILEEYGA
jgi:hypothetical protein